MDVAHFCDFFYSHPVLFWVYVLLYVCLWGFAILSPSYYPLSLNGSSSKVVVVFLRDRYYGAVKTSEANNVAVQISKQSGCNDGCCCYDIICKYSFSGPCAI